MNEIIQNLEANATNGYEQFCYIDEKMLEAIKELAKRENEEKVKLEHNWNELKSWLEETLNELKQNDIYDRTSYETGQIIATECIIAKIEELEEGGNNE